MHDFSPHYLRWCNRLIRKTRTPAWYYVNTTFKKVVIVAILLSMLTFTAMAVPSIRDAIIDFFFHNHGERYGISFDPEDAATAPDMIETAYLLTVVPEGYELIDSFITPAVVNGLWVNADGSMINYIQNPLPENATKDTWIGIDAENVDKTSRIINGYLVEIVQMEASYNLYWTDNEYVYSLELPNTITDETMIEIFLSIKPVDKE